MLFIELMEVHQLRGEEQGTDFGIERGPRLSGVLNTDVSTAKCIGDCSVIEGFPAIVTKRIVCDERNVMELTPPGDVSEGFGP